MATYTGSGLNDILLGSKLADLMFGLAGNDSISGGLSADTLDGGAGNDTLAGGGGNDTYVVDNVKDVIVEEAVGGDDRVLAAISVDLNLPAFANIENATLTGTGALNATGNGAFNMLIGNAGANKLDGKSGNDTAAGGAGNDVYEVDSDKDLVIELATDGIDQVNSSATLFTLSAFVENLTLTAGAGAGGGGGNALANKITGNASGNSLFGDEGNDTLIGNDGADDLNGGAGADSLVGGNGNDNYNVDDAGDKVTESGPASDIFDSVSSSVSYTLGANLESLRLVGDGVIDGTGNALNNFLNGNGEANVLSGLAGDDGLNGDTGNDLLLGGDGKDQLFAAAGADTLVGGAGGDKFIFDAFNNSLDGLDLVADFNSLPGGDQLDLSGVIGQPGKGSESLFIQTVTSGGSTTVRVDQDGLGGKFAFVDLAVLQGVSIDFQGLLANGAIAGLATPATPPIDGTAGNDVKSGAGLSDLIRGLAGNDSLTGNNGFDTLDGGTGMDTMVGGAGNDTYVVDNVKDVITEAAGDTDDRVLASLSVDLQLAAFANIEHATLTGAAALNATGDEVANMLIGNVGANKLDGKGGDDTMIGGAGNDVYEADSDKDVVIEIAGEGIDQVNSSAFAYTLGAFVENLTLLGGAGNGTGNALANKITGNVDSNSLHGGDGNDTLTGNDGDDFLTGDAGADSLVGGKGNDFYVVDNVADKVVENGPASDVDQVSSSITYTLGANLESLSLSGIGPIDGTGNNLNNFIFGSGSDNVLSGLAGDDTLNASAGDDLVLGGDGRDQLFTTDGKDTLVGGAGRDTFEFSGGGLSGLDIIADFDGLPGGDVLFLDLLVGFVSGKSVAADFFETVTADGSTTIRVDRDGTAGAFAFVDMVLLQGVSTDLDGLLAHGHIAISNTLIAIVPPIDGTAGIDNLPGTALSDLMRGLGGNDLLTGNGGADTLDGGAGMDTMVGDTGNDSYVMDNSKDVINELGGDLNDRVLAAISVDLSLSAFAGIEHATLTGTAALNATGSKGDNMLIGNAGANVLDGGAGDDTLIGGAGNDTYKVNSVADVAIERPGEGTDTVISTAFAYTLGAFIENLTLLGGTSDSHGTGNDLANKITGNVGSNSLDGEDGNDTLTGNDGDDLLIGGAGADSMVGGTGDDNYFVDNIGDKIVESGPATDFDVVISGITFTLGANLESLTLVGATELEAIDGTGNGLNNFLFGNDGNNVLSGLGGNDSMRGNGGADLLLAGDGNDILEASPGADTLVGGAGSDVFFFTSSGLDGLDVIADFNGLPGGDALDVSGFLNGFVEDVSNVNDFLRAVQANGSTTLQVDANGAVGGAAFVDMVVLQGVSTSIGGLLNDGSLILD